MRRRRGERIREEEEEERIKVETGSVYGAGVYDHGGSRVRSLIGWRNLVLLLFTTQTHRTLSCREGELWG
jgi:hypothetical protein